MNRHTHAHISSKCVCLYEQEDDHTNLDTVYDEIRTISSIFDVQSKGEEVIEELMADFQLVSVQQSYGRACVSLHPSSFTSCNTSWIPAVKLIMSGPGSSTIVYAIPSPFLHFFSNHVLIPIAASISGESMYPHLSCCVQFLLPSVIHLGCPLQHAGEGSDGQLGKWDLPIFLY